MFLQFFSVLSFNIVSHVTRCVPGIKKIASCKRDEKFEFILGDVEVYSLDFQYARTTQFYKNIYLHTKIQQKIRE